MGALVVMIFAVSKATALAYVIGILVIVGLLTLIPSVIAQTIALALPPDFGVHKKLDVPAYIWLGLAILPLLLLIFVCGMLSLSSFGVFF